MPRQREEGVERTACGRKRRRISSTFCTVYVAVLPIAGKVKVGRTRDIQKRMEHLKSVMKEKPLVCAQIIYGSRDDGAKGEARAIAYLIDKGYNREAREWFDLPMTDLPHLVAGLVAASKDHIGFECMGQFNNAPRLNSSPERRYLFGHRINEARM